MDARQVYQIEWVKNTLEYLRHLTTLSTGAVLLLATFLEKVFPQPKSRGWIVTSLVSFMVAIVACVIAYSVALYMSMAVRDNPQKGDSEAMITFVALCIVWFSFLVGMSSLTVFAVKNLFP
jgi:hypothetical protein